MSVYESPRIRRLRSDLAALEKLAAESSIFGFRPTGRPPQQFVVAFAGQSSPAIGARSSPGVTTRSRSSSAAPTQDDSRDPLVDSDLPPEYLRDRHRLPGRLRDALGSQPRARRTVRDALDMARYQNYDIRSPYNREAAQWAAIQTTHQFRSTPRPLRDGRLALGRVESAPLPASVEPFQLLDLEIDLSRTIDPLRTTNALDPEPRPTPAPARPVDEVVFLD